MSGPVGGMPYGRGMAKAVRILAALRRDGWIESRHSGSHRVLIKGDQHPVWAYHDGVDLGGPPWRGLPATTGTPSMNCGNCHHHRGRERRKDNVRNSTALTNRSATR